MKKQLFTFVMMIALVIGAGSAMGQTKTTPYPGSNYSYTLSSIGLQSVGTGKIILKSDGGTLVPDLNIASNWSVTTATNQTPTDLVPTASGGNSYAITVPSATTAITFSILYDAAIIAGDYDLYVEITQTAGGCSNIIRLDVAVTAPPTLALALTVGAGGNTICQVKNSDPITMTDNTAASVGQTTTWSYIVTPDALTNVANYSFTFVLDNYLLGTTNAITVSSGDATLDVNTGTISVTGATGAVTLTASVTTTTNKAALAVIGTISNTSFTLTSGAGGGTYGGTVSDDTETVTISTMPAIGTFN